MSLTISADEAYKIYRNTGLRKHGVKGATFGNVKKILEWKNVEIKPRPKSDPVLDKKWQSEKNRLVLDFDRILQKFNKRRKTVKPCFFESSKYQTLTYPYSNQEVVSPKIMTQETNNPKLLNSETLNPENNETIRF